jgi:hypothetical protein
VVVQKWTEIHWEVSYWNRPSFNSTNNKATALSNPSSHHQASPSSNKKFKMLTTTFVLNLGRPLGLLSSTSINNYQVWSSLLKEKFCLTILDDDNWMWDLATHPKLLDLLVPFLGNYITLHTTQIIAKPPNIGTGHHIPWHQELDGLISLWICLDDVSEV